MPRPQITHAKPYTFKHGPFAGRTFRSEHAYRSALAALRGGHKFKGIRSASGYAKLRPAARAARERALDALSRMRRQRLSVSAAARSASTTVSNVLRHVGAAIKRKPGGRYVPMRSDRLYRRMQMETTKGPRAVEPPSSGWASLIGRHYSAMRHFLATGDKRQINKFRGKYVVANGKRHYFLTDLDEIERLGRAGEFSFESLYDWAA